MNDNRNNSGFTLVEMLIALAMMATIVSMVYGSYAATAQSVETYSSRLNCSERTSLVLRLMARQIRSAYAPPADPNHLASPAGTDPTKAQANSARPGRVLAERLRPIFQGDGQHPRGELLSFASTMGLAGGANGPRGLSRVRYRHDAIANTLWIDCQPNMDRLGHTDLAPTGRPVLDHVTAVDVAFHDGQRWLPKWSGARSRTLPRAVRIDLSLTDEKGRSYRFGTTVRVFSRAAGLSVSSKQKTGGKRL